MTWFTAAPTIQDAVDAAEAGDVVLVTNGLYQTGGRPAPGSTLTNRVTLLNPVTVRSVNGPEGTLIQGAEASAGGLGEDAVRCVFLAAGATLDGFTLTGGHTLADSEDRSLSAGGGAFCLSTNSSVLTNCILRGNVSHTGGGAFGGRLLGCRLMENHAHYGAGAANSRLENCRVVGNQASLDGGGVIGDLAFEGPQMFNGCVVRTSVLAANRAGRLGGGAAGGTALFHSTLTGNSAVVRGGGMDETATALNCILFSNDAPAGPDYATSGNGSLTYSRAQPPPSGPGNIDAIPNLQSATHLDPDSPCVGVGSDEGTEGLDIDGEPWASPPSMGADEASHGLPVAAVSAWVRPESPQTVAGRPLTCIGVTEGPVTETRWNFGDGTVQTLTSYKPFVDHTWTTPGLYDVTVTAIGPLNPSGVTATARVEVIEGRYYVNAASPQPAAPYLSWETAARTVDDAIQVALPGGTIVVTNGDYRIGGRIAASQMTRVVIDKPVRVESVHGPGATVIRGEPGVRCVWIIDGATLSGFTLRDGNAEPGAGVYSPPAQADWLASHAIVTNCLIVANTNSGSGGGAYRGRYVHCRFERNSSAQGGGAAYAWLENCVLSENTALTSGGGAYGCSLTNCTVAGNRASLNAGGVSYSSLYNSIVYHNFSLTDPNHGSLSECWFTCTTPLPPGEGNIDAQPGLASLSRLGGASPCIAAGSSRFTTGTDIDGEAWGNPPSMGADQFIPGSADGPISVEISTPHLRVPDTFTASFTARIDGRVSHHTWDFGDGTAVTNQAVAMHAWTLPGRYEIRLTAFNRDHPEGVVVAQTVDVVSVPVFHVSANSPAPEFPYDSWDRAARSIQEAVDASLPGRRVRVADGVYETGTRAVGLFDNRVVVDRPIVVESVSGPALTVIRGTQRVRGVYLGTGATLTGFTVSDSDVQGQGGGVFCEDNRSSVVTNCVLARNNAYIGGGAYGGTLLRSRLIENVAGDGGGASSAHLSDCELSQNHAGYGGGAAHCTLTRCHIVANTAAQLRGGTGGGAYLSDLDQCLILRNRAYQLGGGVSGGRLVHCTVAENVAGGIWWLEPLAGGAASAEVINSIVYFNTCEDATNRVNDNHYLCPITNSCTSPLPSDSFASLDADPGFADRASMNLHLLPSSPCIDRGAALASGDTTDLDGVPRPLDGDGDGVALPDLGAFEFLLSSADSNSDGIPDGWTWRFGLDSTDPNLASMDPDQDGATTLAEWSADTDPTDSRSLFGIERLSPGPPVEITFLTSSNRLYRLESRRDLGPFDPWHPVTGQGDQPGTGARVSLSDTNDSGRAAYYRVRVHPPSAVAIR